MDLTPEKVLVLIIAACVMGFALYMVFRSFSSTERFNESTTFNNTMPAVNRPISSEFLAHVDPNSSKGVALAEDTSREKKWEAMLKHNVLPEHQTARAHPSKRGAVAA